MNIKQITTIFSVFLIVGCDAGVESFDIAEELPAPQARQVDIEGDDVECELWISVSGDARVCTEKCSDGESHSWACPIEEEEKPKANPTIKINNVGELSYTEHYEDGSWYGIDFGCPVIELVKNGKPRCLK